jgi:hypothetical protein
MMAMVAGHGISREQFERDALRLLCSELIQPVTRVQLTGLVKDSAFRNELNRVVYEEIAAVGAVPTRRLRELLPGRVTLRGFPDFDLREFLGRDGAKDDDIDRWFESLLELTEEPPEAGKKAMGQSA